MDTRDFAFDGIVDSGGADLVERVSVHFGDGCGHDALFLDTVTDDYRLVEHLGIILQDDFQLLLLRDRDGPGHIADAGYLQDGTGRDAEGEFTVQAGCRAVAGALLDHESADNRLTGPVEHDTCHGDVLREGRQGQS